MALPVDLQNVTSFHNSSEDFSDSSRGGSSSGAGNTKRAVTHIFVSQHALAALVHSCKKHNKYCWPNSVSAQKFQILAQFCTKWISQFSANVPLFATVPLFSLDFSSSSPPSSLEEVVVILMQIFKNPLNKKEKAVKALMEVKMTIMTVNRETLTLN